MSDQYAVKKSFEKSFDGSKEQVSGWTPDSTFPAVRPVTSPPAPLLRVLYTVLLCLTLTGAADAAALAGPVIGWGRDSNGQASPPDDVNGMGHRPAALDTKPQLGAWVPRIVFPSIEAAAVDALIYTYLQASSAHDTERMCRPAQYFKLDTFHRIGAGLMAISAR
jgi:hypothetical protein